MKHVNFTQLRWVVWLDVLRRVHLGRLATGAVMLVALLSGVGSGLAEAADAVPPSTPGNFQATVSSGDPAVTLTWTASTDAGGIKAYRIDRSLDQSSWKTLDDTTTALTFKDTTSGFGLHYYYRLSASDMAGNMSGWANADVTVEAASATTRGSSEVTYTSDDKRATVQLPEGLAAMEISCSVASDTSSRPSATQKQPVVMGPYKLECKTVAGSIMTDFKKSVTWGLDLKDKLKNLRDPVIYVSDGNGVAARAQDSHYDAKAQYLRATAPAGSTILVKANVPERISFSFIAVILILLAIIGGVAVLIVNRRKKQEYDEYLRSKYYEL